MSHKILFPSLLGLLLGFAAAPSLSAQTTHQVDLDGFSFLPADLTINEGDTVLWNWVSGFHNVLSDDGFFASGAATLPPATFAVTFDAAFLAAAPANGNVYNYHCVPHLALGMVGSITVTTANPVLTITNLVAGSQATMTVDAATPFGPVGFAYSLAGPGPSTVPAGPCGLITTSLSLPITLLPQVNADAAGKAILRLNVPPSVAGLPAWVQSLDLASCRLSNGASMVIG